MSSRGKYARLGADYHWQPGWRDGAYGRWVARVLAYFPEDGDGATVLDAGCGDGYPASLLVARGYRVIGVDELEGPLAAARERVPGAEFGTAWPENAVDYVLALESVEHMTDPTPLVEAVKACKAYALVSCPLPGMDPDAEQSYGPEDIKRLFGGLAVEHLVNEGEHQLYKITSPRGRDRPPRERDRPPRKRGRPRVTPEDRGQEALEIDDADRGDI